MKLLIILLAMIGVGAGVYHSYQSRQLLIEAALLSEAFDLAGPVKLRIADYYVQHGVMANDNAEAGLASPKSIFGASVKRVSVNLGGVLIVDFEEEIGARSLILTPSLSNVSGLLNWRCTSDSIEPELLAKLKPVCHYSPATDQNKLMHAIANRQTAIVEQLLTAGAQPGAIVNGNTPLMLAAKIGDVEIVNALLEAGAAVDHDAVNSQRRTPLMVAITSNHAEVAATLLGHGSSIYAVDYQGRSAMDHAKATDERLGGERYILMLSASLNPKFGRSVVDPGVNINKPVEVDYIGLYNELYAAARQCRPQRIQAALEQHREFRTDELVEGKLITDHIRMPACSKSLMAFIKTKDIYRRAVRAKLSLAVRSCDTKHVEKIVAGNPRIELFFKRDGESILERAVESGCTDAVSAFMRRQDRPEFVSTNLLIRALENTPSDRVLRMVSILIAADVDVNAVDRKSRTPLSVAIAIEQPVVAKYLVDAGANVTRRTNVGSYPLIDASKKGYDHLVAELIRAGGDVNSRDKMGRTALLVAVAQGHNRLVDILLRAGANPRLKDQNGIDAVILAESKDKRQLKLLLTTSASNALDN